jgi:hypothetical protein
VHVHVCAVRCARCERALPRLTNLFHLEFFFDAVSGKGVARKACSLHW